jgi:uncharacterized protein YxjI
MEIKLVCGCGTKYKFDVEPIHGRMPVQVQCPGCGADGTTDANQILAQKVPYTPASSAPRTVPPPPAAASEGLRISSSASQAGATVASDFGLAATFPTRGYASASLLGRTIFFIKERVAILKLTDTYDILDPASGQTIGIAKEEPPVWAKWLRLVVKKHLMPTAINIYENEGQPPVVSIRRGFTIIRSKLRVVASDGRSLGYFKSKLISIGGGFLVFDHADQQVAEVKGDWKGWNFRFLNKGGREIGTVTKKWGGLGKELFTSADNYIIALTDLSGASADASALLLAAGLSIDIVYKERD